MKKMAEKLGALGLALALTFSLAPAASAADLGYGADLNLSGAANGSGGQYTVTYTATLTVDGNDMAPLINGVKTQESLSALRFTCYLEDALLGDAVEAGDLSAPTISGDSIFQAVGGPVKTSGGASMTYQLTSTAISQLLYADANNLPQILDSSMSTTISGTLTNSEVRSAVGSASSITTRGYITATLGERTVTLTEDTCTTTISPTASGGSSGGGSSSGGSSSGTTTETERNPDGSTTTTVTRPNGTVTETTTQPDGSTTEVVTRTDGSSTTTVEQADGSSSVTTVDRNGQAETTVEIPTAVVNEAEADDAAVSLPMPPVTDVEVDREDAHTITVDLSGAEQVTVEIPVENPTPGTVAVLVNPDGSEEVLRTCVTTDTGVLATLNSGDTIKIVDNSVDFVDVPNTHWASDYVDFAASRGLFSGTSANTFSPDTAMTRGMIVTVLSRFDNVESTGGSVWYEAGRDWAMANGISDGTGMENVITREQLALMLYRYAGAPAVSGTLNTYPDGSTVSSWAEEGMIWAVQNGLISGDGNGALDPQGSATRAQVATILRQYIANVLN